jgi:acyl-CoA thioesterase II
MNPLVADLLKILQLKQIAEGCFEGEGRDPGHHRLYGGHVLAQALAAAYATVDDRDVHSLHAYFLRAGDPADHIRYQVERARDGISFASRRVSATQSQAELLHLSVSFQVAEDGIDRQASMPDVREPESCPDMATALEEFRRLAPDRPSPFLLRQRPFEFRPAELPDPQCEAPRVPNLKIWFRVLESLPDNERLHRCVLTYASDYYLLSTAALDIRLNVDPSRLQLASIDHAMWFHRPVRVDDWLLYVLDSPTASGSRGFAQGKIFNRSGHLVASTAQEGVVRRKR